MTEQELLQTLAAMRDDTPPFGSVEERVAAAARGHRHPRALPLWLLAAAAAALIVLTLAARQAWRVESMPAVEARHIAAPALEIRKTNPVPVVHRRRPRAVQTARPPATTETLTVKLLTDDPNVVIYWIVEGQGE